MRGCSYASTAKLDPLFRAAVGASRGTSVAQPLAGTPVAHMLGPRTPLTSARVSPRHLCMATRRFVHPRLSVAEHSSFHAVDAAFGVVEHPRADLLSMHSESSSSSGGTQVNEMPSLGGSAASFRKSGSSLASDDGTLATMARAQEFSDDESDGPGTSFRDTGNFSTRAVVNRAGRVLAAAAPDDGDTQTPSPLASTGAERDRDAAAPQFVDITPGNGASAAPVPTRSAPDAPAGEGEGSRANTGGTAAAGATAAGGGAGSDGDVAADVRGGQSVGDDDVASPADISVHADDHDE